jgi:hypothetical protein
MLKVSRVIKGIFLYFLFSLLPTLIFSQIRMESFFGDDEPVIDVFWVKPIQENSSFLFLNRNKFALPSYQSDSPRFSSLNILSYQLKDTGLGLAIAATASNAGFEGRTGIQFLKVKPKEWLFYTIASTSLGKDGDFRSLWIAQFTPKLSNKWRWFNRLEWISAFGYEDQHRLSQGILKEGLLINGWQFGMGFELLWLGKSFTSVQQNWGIFLARDF